MCFVLFIQCNRGYVISGLAVSLERACSFSRQSLMGEIDKPYKLPKGTRYCLVYPIPLPPLRSAAPMPLIRPLVSYQTLQAIPNGEYPYILSVSLVRFVRQECVYIYNFYPYNPYKPYKLPKGTRYCLVYPIPYNPYKIPKGTRYCVVYPLPLPQQSRPHQPMLDEFPQ